MGGIQQLITEARRMTAVAVNASLTPLYLRISQCIHTEVLGQGRADYGQEVLPTLSAELMPRRPAGYATLERRCLLPRWSVGAR